jgi:hypothetical protein
MKAGGTRLVMRGVHTVIVWPSLLSISMTVPLLNETTICVVLLAELSVSSQFRPVTETETTTTYQIENNKLCKSLVLHLVLINSKPGW